MALFPAAWDGNFQLADFLLGRYELPPFAVVGPIMEVHNSSIIDFMAAGGDMAGDEARPTDEPETLVFILGLTPKKWFVERTRIIRNQTQLVWGKKK